MTREELANFISSVDKEEFTLFFKSHGVKKILDKYNLKTIRDMTAVRDAFGIKLTKEELAIKNAISVKESFQEKYGVDNVFQLETIKEKSKKTMLDKFGVEHPGQSLELMQKAKDTKVERYGDENYNNIEKHIKTILKLVDADKDYYAHRYEKQKQTYIKKYGSVSAAFESRNSKINWAELTNKQIETKKRAHSFKKSKKEDLYYNYLCNIYGSDDVVRQYSDDRYPFSCDFYIKSRDLFIECNFHWTHGYKQYDSEDLFCKEQLSKWVEKAKTSDFYKNAINTWTVRDVKKLQTEKNNKLNYLVVYNINDLE